MVKICPKCGKNNLDDAFWCVNCNSRITDGINIINTEEKPVSTPIQKNYPINETKNNLSISQKIEKKKSILSIKFFMVLIVIVLIIGIVIVGFYQLNSDEEKFIGTWRSSNSEGTMTFESGFFSKTVTSNGPTTEPTKGSWRCKNGILYMEFDLGNIKANACNIYLFEGDNIILNPSPGANGNQVTLTRI